MARLSALTVCAAASCAIASLSGCVVSTSNGRNGTMVTVNGVRVSGVTGSNSAAESVQKKFKAGSVVSLKLDNDTGSIHILPAGSGADEILVQATKTVHGSDSAEKLKPLLAAITVQAELIEGALVLSASHPAEFDKRNISVTIDYIVTVPARLALDLRTGSGAITASGVNGNVRMHSSYGDIAVTDVEGALDVSTGSGTISIESASTVTGIKARSSYGSIDLRAVSGDIEADTSSGSITVKGANSSKASGSIKLTSGYGDVTVSDSEGSVDASSGSGVVKLADCRLLNHVTLHSDYGNVLASGVTSVGTELKADLTTQSGSITFNGDASELTLQSDYGSVDAELAGTLSLRAAALRSASGTVSLVLPASASAKINASTSSGTVDLPSGRSGDSGSMTLGAGAAQVTLKSEYGNISVRTK